MTVLIDPPAWPAHGRLWSHLVSDASLAELHAFARRAGVPERGFDGDHYDVPAERYDALVAAGAVPVPARELLRRLVASGLRVPHLRGERVLKTGVDHEWLALAGPHRLDVVASPRWTPAEATAAAAAVVVDGAGRLLLAPSGDLPATDVTPGGDVARELARAVAEQTGVVLETHRLVPAGYERLRLGGEPPSGWTLPAPWSYRALLGADVAVGRPGRWLGVEEARTRVGHRRWWPVAERVLTARTAGV